MTKCLITKTSSLQVNTFADKSRVTLAITETAKEE